MRVEAAASWEGLRLFLSGAGGPFPDFSFATLFGATQTRARRLFIGNSDTIKVFRKVAIVAAPGIVFVRDRD